VSVAKTPRAHSVNHRDVRSYMSLVHGSPIGTKGNASSLIRLGRLSRPPSIGCYSE
jgi:hypothetical protein